jgi:F-type H+-transporting ATPase subunit a
MQIPKTALAVGGDGGNPFPIAPNEIFKIGGFSVTETMLSGLFTVVVIVLFFAVIRIFFIPRWNRQPFKKSGFRLGVEKVVLLFDKNAREQTHGYAGVTSSLYLGLSSYICVATLIELFGLRPSTTDLNLTLLLGVTTFIMIFTLGFAKKRQRRLLHYLNPINWIIDGIVPFSMALRVFMSIFSGYIILHLLYAVPFLSVGIPVVANVLLTLLHAVIQAFMFMYLSMTFINEAVE